MRLTQLLIIGLLSAMGCKKENTQTVIINAPMQTTVNTNINTKADTVLADTVTYLALGDSYTIGQSVTPEDSYPFQLTAQLRANKLKAGSPQIVARTGWTTTDLITALSTANLNPKYSLVTLLIGVNNQYQNFDPEAYRRDFDQLVTTAIQFAKGGVKHVYVLSIPDYSVTPFAKDSNTDLIAQQLQQYNAINEGESARLRVNYVNITPISLQAKTDLSLLANDGLHPSGKQYALWVQQLLPKVLGALK